MRWIGWTSLEGVGEKKERRRGRRDEWKEKKREEGRREEGRMKGRRVKIRISPLHHTRESVSLIHHTSLHPSLIQSSSFHLRHLSPSHSMIVPPPQK